MPLTKEQIEKLKALDLPTRKELLDALGVSDGSADIMASMEKLKAEFEEFKKGAGEKKAGTKASWFDALFG